MEMIKKEEGGELMNVEIRVRGKEVVAAALPLQEHWLPLSNLDLLLPPVDVGVFFCYSCKMRPEDDPEEVMRVRVRAVKEALAQALVPYYAFAGEVVGNTVGEPELLCNNRGVDFTHAVAPHVRLQDLPFHYPHHLSLLLPLRKNGVLCVQVTEMKCGGMVVGCAFDHRIADAYSANLFLVSWAEMAQSKPLSVIPSFRRSLLNPRRPGFYHPSLDDMYVPLSALPPPPKEDPHSDADHLISRLYYVTAEQLSHLQTLASSGGRRRTKLESLSAFLWKMAAASAADNKTTCKMGIVVDGRQRLAAAAADDDDDEKKKKKKKMATYFGNVLSLPFGEKSIGDLKEQPLSSVADAVHDFLQVALTKDHFLGLIDWVEAHRPEPALAKIYCQSGGRDGGGPAFAVSSGQRFPLSEVDFGWGRPVLGSYHFPWGGEAGYVMPMPSPARDDDWIVYLHLSKPQIKIIEDQASHIFRPLTSQYLKLLNN